MRYHPLPYCCSILGHGIPDVRLRVSSTCRLYVPEELIPLYKECIVPNVSLLTPNQFELQLLSGRAVTNIADGIEACKELHKLGTESVVRPSSKLVHHMYSYKCNAYTTMLQSLLMSTCS